MDTDYVDDIALLANTLTQAESLLHSLEQAIEVSASMWMQTKHSTCFNQDSKWQFSEISGQVHVPQ